MTTTPERTDWRAAARADKAADREQDRLDRQQQAQAQLEREEREAARRAQERRDREDAQTRRRAEADEARRKNKEEKEAARAKAKRDRAAVWRQRRRTARDNWDVALAVLVMVAGVVPALIFQHKALVGMRLDEYGLAVLLPVMFELAAWASTAGEVRALREKRNATPYRIGVWSSAVLAATVNASHAPAGTGWIGPVILAATSVVPIAILHMVMAGRHDAKAKRTKAEVAAARKAKADDKARVKHAKDRRRHHPKVAEVADRLLSAAPFGSVDADTAWSQAWEVVHGAAAPGMTPEWYAAAAGAKRRLTASFELAPDEGERIRQQLLEAFYGPAKPGLPKAGAVSALRQKTPKKAQVHAHLSPSPEDGEKTPRPKPVPPRRRKGDGLPFHPLAKAASARAARERLAVNGAANGSKEGR